MESPALGDYLLLRIGTPGANVKGRRGEFRQAQNAQK